MTISFRTSKALSKHRRSQLYLAAEIATEFGSGFSVRTLEQCRQFYRTYPIVNALRSQFNWYQYRLLIQIDNGERREYYELESLNNAWTGRELERQINAGLYERLLLSNDKELVLEIARQKRILTSKYQLYLPTEKQLLTELKRELEENKSAENI